MKKKLTLKQQREVNHAADMIARVLFMSVLEQHGLNPFQVPRPFQDVESPEAEQSKSACKAGPSKAR